MDIGSMGFTDVVGETLPAVLVEFGKVSLVLGVHDVHRVPTNDHNVGNEMAQATVRRVRPLDREDGLSTPTNANYSTVEGGLSTDERLDIVLPELFER